ncbi:aldolase [Paenibacillus sp. J5C_2022]|uniref:aldolase n=1 Tax=Paenibacillus sp. J5C2022 TaxID=2977129 RepID=UPI0021CF3977|nr:aldolase [Paenibacillus sp. J5C2022]MCU6710569.1 aldolase [Paenibacillus sp. J5C2022]
MTAMNQKVYQAFGLLITSEIALTGEEALWADAGEADASIHWGDLSEMWSQLSEPEERYVIRDNFVLLHMPHTATYLIEDGCRIIVSPIGTPPPERIRLYLDGYCMGALLLQRGILPLHGTAVVIEGKAYGIIGRSGAGKSTLAKAFLDHGYAFLTDDVIPVRLPSGEGEAEVLPALPEQKLWQESLRQLGMEDRGFHPIYEREIKRDDVVTGKKTKYKIPVEPFHKGPLPLGGLFELVKSDHMDGSAALVPVSKVEQLHIVMRHTFNRELIHPLGLLEWHFRTASSLAGMTSVQVLQRSSATFTVQELLQLIVSEVEEVPA